MLQTVLPLADYGKIGLSSAPWTMHEFFAGSGLVAYGLKGMFAPLWANDICPQKASVYEANFGSEHFLLNDTVILERSPLLRCFSAHAQRRSSALTPSRPRHRSSFTVFGCAKKSTTIRMSSTPITAPPVPVRPLSPVASAARRRSLAAVARRVSSRRRWWR